MRIAQLQCDWKEDFTRKEIRTVQSVVGSSTLYTEYVQDNVDSKVMYVSSHPLTLKQMDQLWEVGDLWGDWEVIEGKTFRDCIKDLEDRTAAANKESCDYCDKADGCNGECI